MAKKISGSVGKGGKNKSKDVEIVQKLLNLHAGKGGNASIKVDGIVGDKTIKAIREFQKAFVTKIKPDGLVSTNKQTIKALNEKPKAAKDDEASKPQVFIVELDKEFYKFKTEKEARAFVKTLKKVTIRGKEILLTPKQYDAYVKDFLKGLMLAYVRDLRHRAQGANTIHDYFATINLEELFASWAVQSWWGPKFPSVKVPLAASNAMEKVDGAMRSGNPLKILMAIAANEPIINKSYETMFKYRKAVINRSDGWIKALEFTETASFIILGALAGPALVVAGGATLTQAAFLVGVGTSALPSIGNEVGKSLVGTSEGAMAAIYNVGIDSMIGGTIGVVLKGSTGTEVLKSVEKKLFEKTVNSGWFKKISNNTIKKWLAGYIATTGKASIEETVKTIGNRFGKSLKGESYTKKKFYEDVGGGVISTFTAGFLKPFENAVDTKFAPNLYNSIMKSKATKDMFKSLPKNKAIKAIEDVMKGTGGDVTGKILGWGMGKFGVSSADAGKLVVKTATEAIKSPNWGEFEKLLLNKIKK